MEKQNDIFKISRNYKRALVALFIAIFWGFLSMYLALPWLNDLKEIVYFGLGLYIIITLAIIPGVMNMFLIFMVLVKKDLKNDNQPVIHLKKYPEIDIMIAAYNEEKCIDKTVNSILESGYPGKINIYCVNDGSSDKTLSVLKEMHKTNNAVEFINNEVNLGKAKSLNRLLPYTKSSIVVTIDADSILEKGALTSLIDTYNLNPNVVAVAGNIKQETNDTFIQKLQRYDYDIAIFAIKTAQGMLNGVLVAQGAFSAYNGDLIRKYAYPENTVGEDIVVTWKFLEDENNIILYDRHAICYTMTPDTFSKFFKQRVRWARGMIEAFKSSPNILIKKRGSTSYILCNTMFPFIDLTYTFVFLPSLIYALITMKSNPIVGVWTLFIIPIGLLQNLIIAKKNNCKIDAYFILYSLCYGIFNQTASLLGYSLELIGGNKKW